MEDRGISGSFSVFELIIRRTLLPRRSSRKVKLSERPGTDFSLRSFKVPFDLRSNATLRFFNDAYCHTNAGH